MTTTTLFTMPLKDGKKDDYKAFLAECMGPRKSDYQDLLKRYGLNSVKIWLHTLEGKDYAMFIHEMDENAAKLLEGWSTSTHPFDQWFNKHLKDCYTFESLENAPPQPEFFGAVTA